MSKVSILKPQGSYSEVPLYSGRISAGFPGVVDEHMEDTLSLDQLLIKHPATTFFARVEGDSMIEAGIFQNDILVVDRSVSAKDNDIVVALLDNEFTVKRLKSQGTLKLKAENANYPDIEITGEHELVIWGVVTGLARSLR
ncbi:LexA family protein [Kangiella geojedonensis]|uniref:DNA polymerase V n=1 Tax=Kangiella geojedonensis TaxID=914150 RepID=A0A0F6RCD6_9GAMM|nr:translesion error-prone DNA polymerase V autoproteolytic subunit [Kangiella geojedonensis]AKE51956.1 DNA polymerase V [Kangiella geojedonensis]